VLGQAIAGVVSVVGDWWVDNERVTRDELLDDVVALLWSGLPGAIARPGAASDP
jgi:hypothetical protein